MLLNILIVAMIVAAQGEAMSAELIGRAVQKNAGYVSLKRIETAKEIGRILSQGNNRLVLDADALLLNVGANEKYVSWKVRLMGREPMGKRR
jgi:prohibitin 2